MHRDVLSHLVVTPTNFLLTASVDGHLKFWKKKTRKEANAGEPGIEFVKHYRAHLAPILALATSADGLFAASLAADGASTSDETAQGSVKVFDVENFGAFKGLCLTAGTDY
jgi:peptidylprolyl isomerase domain and WD repeat-containing protein 1